MAYVYRMVQVPPIISIRAKEDTGREAAAYMEAIANDHARQGWEFYRVDTIGVHLKPGCLAALFGQKEQIISYYVGN